MPSFPNPSMAGQEMKVSPAGFKRSKEKNGKRAPVKSLLLDITYISCFLWSTDHLLPRSFPILFLRNLLFLLPSPPLRSARDKEGEGNKRKKGEGMGNDVQMVWGPRFLYLLNPTFSFSLFVYSFLILFLCFPFISRAQGAKKARNVRKAIELRRNRNVKGKVFGDSRA